jgi:hypothetical protein
VISIGALTPILVCFHKLEITPPSNSNHLRDGTVVGEKFQSLPLLVLARGKASKFRTDTTASRAFISDASSIVRELHDQYGIPELHP